MGLLWISLQTGLWHTPAAFKIVWRWLLFTLPRWESVRIPHMSFYKAWLTCGTSLSDFGAALSRTMLRWIVFQSFKHCQVVRIDKLEPSQDNPGLCRTRLRWNLASYGQPSTTFLLLILFLLLFLQKVFAVTQLMSVQERQYVCNVVSPQPFCLFGPIFDLRYDFIFTESLDLC